MSVRRVIATLLARLVPCDTAENTKSNRANEEMQ